jgi:ABC-type sugar transport system substrate-binding protein
MTSRKVALFLANPQNDYQQELKEEALAAAARAGLEIEVQFAGADSGRVSLDQSQQIYRAAGGAPEARPVAAIIFPLLDIAAVAKDVAKNGVGVVIIGRIPAFITDLRHAHPSLPVFAVSPDQVEAGRVQGRQLLALLPAGGRVLCIQGNRLAPATTDRTNGFNAVLGGSTITVSATFGAWTAESGEEAFSKWIRQPMNTQQLSAIACQNDQMAVGVRAAIKRLSAEARFEYLREVPILGIDGSRTLGRRMVDAGELAATVVMPSVSRMAIELLSRSLRGESVPVVVMQEPKPYPPRLASR